MSSAGAVPIKTKPSTAAVGKAEAKIQAKQANLKDLKNIDIDSQHLNYEISSIPRESWWKTEEKDVNNDLSHSMSVFPTVECCALYFSKLSTIRVRTPCIAIAVNQIESWLVNT